VIISSPNVHTEEMLSAFESLIDWKKPICFCAVDICISSDIAEMCRKNGKLLEVDPCDLLAMTVEAANSVQVMYGKSIQFDLIALQVIFIAT